MSDVARLPERLASDLAVALALIGIEEPSGWGDEDRDLEQLAALAIDLVAERLEETAGDDGLAGALLRLHRDLLEMHANARNERLAALMSVHDALLRLRAPQGVRALVAQAPVEICRSYSFDRAVLLRLEERTLTVESFAGGRVGVAQVAVEAGSAEEQVLEERTGLLVDDRSRRSTLAAAMGIRSLALAAVVAQGDVLGVLAVDRARSQRALQRVDRDTLAAFASGVGYAIERAALLERLHAQRDEVLRLIRAAELVARELCDFQIQLSNTDDADAAFGSLAALLSGQAARIDALLTDREIDVMEAMVHGATNAEIAARLFISEDTVKSHVKRILAKLGASNRVDAVSRFVRAAVEQELRGPSPVRESEIHSVKR